MERKTKGKQLLSDQTRIMGHPVQLAMAAMADCVRIVGHPIPNQGSNGSYLAIRAMMMTSEMTCRKRKMLARVIWDLRNI